MTDQKENKIIDKEEADFYPGLEEMLAYALSCSIAKRLYKDTEVTDEYRMLFVHDLAKEAISGLREAREAGNYPEPKDYPPRYKVLINRMFRYNAQDDIPFPEVDTPYERFRAQLYFSAGIKLRVVRVERRPRK
ncbi:MAG: hypothetical protein J6L83_02995 [Clostridia bacterium]|nr:hypothetical protein [Clostridia bacterium]